MPRPLLIFSQSDCLIQIVATNSHTEWQTVQTQISWQKPTDLDLHCLQRLGMSGFSRTRVNKTKLQHGTQLLTKSLLLHRFHLTFNILLSKQTVPILIRRCVLRPLIWVCTLCQCPSPGFTDSPLLTAL